MATPLKSEDPAIGCIHHGRHVDRSSFCLGAGRCAVKKGEQVYAAQKCQTCHSSPARAEDESA